MSVIIIGGGEKLRKAIADAESKSLTQNDAWRTKMAALMDECAQQIIDLNNCKTESA